MGTLVSLSRALALALALGLTREQYATLLPKSVTTAISMDVAAELGGIAALTGAIVILTGIAGNLLAESVCKWFHITDPIAKGVGIGTSAHAVGTSKALQMGERPFHRRGRCPHCRPLPVLCRADPLNPDRITAHPCAGMCCLLYNANALCPSRQGAFAFWFSIVSSGG